MDTTPRLPMTIAIPRAALGYARHAWALEPWTKDEWRELTEARQYKAWKGAPPEELLRRAHRIPWWRRGRALARWPREELIALANRAQFAWWDVNTSEAESVVVPTRRADWLLLPIHAAPEATDDSSIPRHAALGPGGLWFESPGHPRRRVLEFEELRATAGLFAWTRMGGDADLGRLIGLWMTVAAS